jgi:phosphoglycolate phosphatase
MTAATGVTMARDCHETLANSIARLARGAAMTDNSFAIVGFDLDGTLLDTSGDLAAAVNHALARGDRPALAEDQVRGIIGGGTRHMFAQALAATGGCDEEALDTLLPHLLRYYEEHLVVKTAPYPGCLDALNTLADRGVRLAVVTNKIERLAMKVLEATGLRTRFATVIGGDTLGDGRGKPRPDLLHLMVERCGGGAAAYVGDSAFDVAAASAAGLPVVACRFGFSGDGVDALGADAVIERFADLVPTLDRLAGARP